MHQEPRDKIKDVDLKAKLLLNLMANSDKAANIRYNIFLHYGRLAELVYNPNYEIEELIKANPDTFAVLLDSTIIGWAKISQNSPEFITACEKWEFLRKMMQEKKQFIQGLKTLSALIRNKYDNLTYDQLENALKKFKKIKKQDENEYKDLNDTTYNNNEDDYDFTEDDFIEEEENEEDDFTEEEENKEDDFTEEEENKEDDFTEEEDEEEKYYKCFACKDERKYKKKFEEIGAEFRFTEEEKEGIEEALKAINYNKDEQAKDDFIAIRRTNFSITIIASLRRLTKSKFQKFAQEFGSYCKLSEPVSIKTQAYGVRGWYAASFVDKVKFKETVVTGDVLKNYKELGDLKKIWLGFGLDKDVVQYDLSRDDRSFNLIGGTSQSGKTCLSHSIIIQAICGGILPIFLDWKPGSSGASLYKEKGFFTIYKREHIDSNSRAGLLNLLEGLACIEIINLLGRKRGGKDNFIENHACPEDPVILFVFDEINAFIEGINACELRKKSSKNITPEEQARDGLFKLGCQVLGEFSNDSINTVATFGIKVLGITQRILYSDSVWNSSVWQTKGDRACSFRVGMQTEFWGKGNLTGSNCPKPSSPIVGEIIKDGQGAFLRGTSSEDYELFKGLRIDNKLTKNKENINYVASTVLEKCLKKLGKGLPENRFSFFNDLYAEVMASNKFETVKQLINDAYSENDKSSTSWDKPELVDDTPTYTGPLSNQDIEIGDDIDIDEIEVDDIDDEIIKKAPTRNLYQEAEYYDQDIPELDAILNAKQDKDTRFYEMGTSEEFNEKQTTDTDSSPQHSKTSRYKREKTKKQEYDEKINISYEAEEIFKTNKKKKRKRTFKARPDSYKNAIKLERNEFIDCKSGWVLKSFEGLLLQTKWGVERYRNNLWDFILEKIKREFNKNTLLKSASIYKVSLLYDNMMVNNRLVDLNGLLGEEEYIPLKCIVSFKTLFKKFPGIKEILIDEEMFTTANAELGKNTFKKIFDLSENLEMIKYFSGSSRGEYKIIKRFDVKNEDTKTVENTTKFRNWLDAVIFKKIADYSMRPPDKIWALRVAQKGTSKAGEMFFRDKNRSVFRAGLLFTGSVAVGTLGAAVWATSKAMHNILSLMAPFRK